MKKIIAIGLGVLVLVLVAVFWVWPRFSTPAPTNNSGVPAEGSGGAAPKGTTVVNAPVTNLPPGGLTQVASPKSTYDIAAARAKLWHPDTGLVKVLLGDVNGGQWTFTFVSSKMSGKGFEVTVSGQKVVSAQEISYGGFGAVLPANIISPDQAIALAHAIPGYANAVIVSIEMIYNATAHTWYWGIKTNNGVTLTIKATP